MRGRCAADPDGRKADARERWQETEEPGNGREGRCTPPLRYALRNVETPEKLLLEVRSAARHLAEDESLGSAGVVRRWGSDGRYDFVRDLASG
jgi:hypothetical protein